MLARFRIEAGSLDFTDAELEQTAAIIIRVDPEVQSGLIVLTKPRIS